MRIAVFGCVLWVALLVLAGSRVALAASVSPEEVRDAYLAEAPRLKLLFPGGELVEFELRDTPFVPGGLGVRTLEGKNGGRTARVVLTETTLSAQLFSIEGTAYVNSRSTANGKIELTISPRGSEGRGGSEHLCLPMLKEDEPAARPGGFKAQSHGTTLSIFRLAAAATAEYTEYFGSKQAALREVVTALYRADGIFQRELGISFELVAGFDAMIFTDSASDPYSSNEPTERLLEQAQAAFDSIIGTENYDVGILLTRGTFGLTYIRSVCDPLKKGASCIGLPEPKGENFHILVAHELAHQFGANHTFNSPLGICSERRNGFTAYEPAAGSTIMSYATLPCGTDSFQGWHDDYFHSVNIQEIQKFLRSPAATCARVIEINNQPPIISPLPEFVIPVGTPFALTAEAADPDGDEMTFCWEQFDLGPAVALGAPDNGSSPLFRSRAPARSPTRLFPALPHLLAGGDAPEERLPQTNRIMHFRVTVRDSHALGAVSWEDMRIIVTNTAGPFRITSHNQAEVLSGKTRIDWTAGGTASPPISAEHVRISLSTNGGHCFPIVLAESTLNDGSEEVQLPPIDADDVRIKIEPLNNIFFDINDAPLRVRAAIPLSLIARRTQGGVELSWAARPGATYRIERSAPLNGSGWIEALRTNAASSGIQVELPNLGTGAYYRLVQE